MFKFLNGLFVEEKPSTGPNLKARLTLDGMEQRDAPALLAYVPAVQSVAVPSSGANVAHLWSESVNPLAHTSVPPGPC